MYKKKIHFNFKKDILEYKQYLKPDDIKYQMLVEYINTSNSYAKIWKVYWISRERVRQCIRCIEKSILRIDSCF